jgi:UDP-glucose 4-epimerase
VRVFVTGCAGFIGSHLVERLLADGHDVAGLDDLSTGRERFLAAALASPRFRFHRGDLRDGAATARALEGCDLVFHLAANADVRHGRRDPRRDLERNTLATFALLEVMRAAQVRRIAFTSSGAVYGDAAVVPTPEDAPFPVQSSLYGASKLAAEALLGAYASGFGFRAWVLRLVSVLGERYSHGHVFDFYKKIQADPREVEVLGDGRQRKSYLYVGDCVDALASAVAGEGSGVTVLNVGADEDCTVDDSLGWICAELGARPRRRYTGGDRGWPGDSPHVRLDTTRLRALGWRPRVGIREGVERTVRYLRANPWLLERD